MTHFNYTQGQLHPAETQFEQIGKCLQSIHNMYTMYKWVIHCSPTPRYLDNISLYVQH